MNSIIIYTCVVTVLGCSEFGHAKEVSDLLIRTSGAGGLPVANDPLYNFYIKDYFGIIAGYSEKMAEIKQQLENRVSQLKPNAQSVELIKHAHTQVVDYLSTYLKEVIVTYSEVTPVGISQIVDAVNHMRRNEREFNSKVNVNLQQCYDLVDKYSFYKWENPAIYCAHHAVIASITIQLRYTNNINTIYARFDDQFNRFDDIPDGDKQNYVGAYLKGVQKELQDYSRATVKSIKALGSDVAVCVKKSYEEFEMFKNSLGGQAVGCF